MLTLIMLDCAVLSFLLVLLDTKLLNHVRWPSHTCSCNRLSRMWRSDCSTRQKQKRPWSTMECSQPTAWTTNRSLLVASRDRPFQEDRPIPARPYPELRTRMMVRSGVISVSPHTLEMLRHLPTYDQPPGFVPHAY